MIQKFFIVSFIFLSLFIVTACTNNDKGTITNYTSDIPQENTLKTTNDDLNNTNNDSLLRVCPEAWYENRMPTVVNNPNDPQPVRQYFIISGQRVETSEVDINWVMVNCDIRKPSIIY